MDDNDMLLITILKR